jgi:predicted AlkP superfamily pyrophosphatase or phosphodiesterase
MKYLKIVLILVCSISFGQKKNKVLVPAKPKLILGIVVDQMRYDYLYKYAEKYGNGGFKRLMNDGFNCKNNHYPYAATYTGPGHAHIFNGSLPALSGIVGNEWFDRSLNRAVYVAEDTTVLGIGNADITAGKMSPRNMKVTSICDQLRLSNQFQSKVFGIAFKDRGSILPAGHTANAAYWFDVKSGNWITSTYYMKDLPDYVKAFNAQKRPQELIAKPWETLYPIETYSESEADNQPYENPLVGEKTTTFPHTISSLSVLPTSPYGNTLTKEFALKLIEKEQLGKSNYTDFLTLSFSSPDYIGHSFGTASVEIEDTYLRLDKDLEEILNYLDKNVGQNAYTVFLTADHGAAEIPAYLKKNKVPAGLFIGTELKKQIDTIANAVFGNNKWIIATDNYQLYLNHDLLKSKGMTVKDFYEKLKPEIIKIEGVYHFININDLNSYTVPDQFKSMIVNTNHPKRSGDLMVLLEPAWFSGYAKGTTHGTGWSYDTHVPLLFYGCGINKGYTNERTSISDIAPTLASFLNILEPNGSVGNVIIPLLGR